MLLPAALVAQTPPPVEALLYSTMPSLWDHRPTMAMDGDGKTAFRSVGGMDDGDGFTVLLSRPIAARSIRVETGESGVDALTNASLETSPDGTTWTKAAAFAGGVAEAKPSGPLLAVRIRMEGRRRASHLVVREIAIDSSTPVAHVQMGPGRGFTDLGGNADLAGWAAKAESQMESFWPDAAALLYSKGFVTPNAVYVQYRTGPRVTAVAATGGGVMTVNTVWARAHPEDTGLTVHEMTHVVQSGGGPGWLIEAIADYIRWVRFEPQNFTFRIDPAKATPHDPYRTGAAFLGWCELHYAPFLATEMNDAARFGRYNDGLFLKYCGKDIDALWKEFLAADAKDHAHLLSPPVSAAMQPRNLPTVTRSVPVDIPFTTVGTVKDGATFRPNGGFDDGGEAYSATLMGSRVTTNGVEFRLGPTGVPNALRARGNAIRLSGSHKTLWMLGAAIDGSQHDQTMTVTYDDGTAQGLIQNFSDWAQPESFPGESRTLEMPYRNGADGAKEVQRFFAYAYGFALDPAKTLRTVTLPYNPNVRILAISLAD